MKRIINGRLWDDNFMEPIGSRMFVKPDPVTGEPKQYQEELMREYVRKPGCTLEDTWVKTDWGSRKIVKENCDLAKGQFVLKITQRYDDGIFVPVTDEEARAWFEKWAPDDVNRYEELFGSAKNPWTEDGAIKAVEQAESRVNSMKWDKERAEERASKAEAEIARLKAKLAALSRPMEPEV